MKTSSTTFPFLRQSLLTLLILPILVPLAYAFPSDAPAGKHAAPEAGRLAAGRAAAGSAAARRTAAAASVIYSTPYLQADPHAKDYHIAINIESVSGATLCDPATMEIELRFYASLFYPRSVTQGAIIENNVNGQFRTIKISLAGATQVANGALTEVVGDVMLGHSESTPLTLVSIRCNGTQVTDSVRSGDLSMTGAYCEEGSDRLLDYKAGFGITKIAPNPTRGGVTVNVLTVAIDEASLEIYSSIGQRVYATSWIPASNDDAEMTRDIALPADLPNGIYEMVLRSPGRRDTKTLIIAK